MQNLADIPEDPKPKIPRKRRTKVEPTEAELEEQFRTVRRALFDRRKRTRDMAITRLGTLAYNSGLAAYTDETLGEHFVQLAARLSLAEGHDDAPA